jgi:hypothetical protein
VTTLRSLTCAALACAPLAGMHGGALARAPHQQAGGDDSALLQCASEQGWRGLIDALERADPPRTDDAKSALERARLRIDATDPRRSSRDRAASWRALDAAHARRVAAAAADATSRRDATIERATDALRIGFFAEPSTASACASGHPQDCAVALALLQSVEESTRNAAGPAVTSQPDRTIAFLNVASRALQAGIDRGDRGGASSRDRRTRAADLLELVRAERVGIPPALHAVADLAECAAASAAGDADAARAAAVRIVYLGEPLPAMFGRIFVCDALAQSRMGDRALAELVQVIRVDGLSLPLRILAADAYVRLRDSLGKSSVATPTFEAYGEVMRRSGTQDRWPARLAVLERLGPITVRAVDTSWLPTEGLVARAHARRIAGDESAGDALRAELDETSPDRVALAAVAGLDAAVRTGDSALAADALKALAIRFADDRTWSGSAAELSHLEIARDAVHPGARTPQLKASIELALALEDEGPTNPLLTAAQQSAEALALARAGSLPPPQAAGRLAQLVAACSALDAAALEGTRVPAAMRVLDACSIDPASPTSPERPAPVAAPHDMHQVDAELLGMCLANRAQAAAGTPAAAVAADRLAALATAGPCASHAARGAREAVSRWLAEPSAHDPRTARALATVLDAADEIDPPDLEDMRLAVRLARQWGGLSPDDAAARSVRARAAAEHAGATRDDMMALADALLDQAAAMDSPREARDTLLAESMALARMAERVAGTARAGGPTATAAIDWSARERMVRAARLAGRSAEADAHVERLTRLDKSRGGNPSRFGDAEGAGRAASSR